MTPEMAGAQTPVLFIVFNRPESTKTVFEAIRAARPRSLYVAADGPRANVAGERERCEGTRRIATAVDWDCTLATHFQERNLGPGPGVSGAISWFFDHVEEGIILEDDCVPSRSFYAFCGELLEYYRKSAKVMHISGHNYQYGRRRGRASYYFSSYTHVGGWATWRRAWHEYDLGLIPERERGEIWDAAWLLSVRRLAGLAVIPNVNLVSNIGFGADATHTRRAGRFAFIPAAEIDFPLSHPAAMHVDQAADTLTYYANFRNVRFLRLLWLYQGLDFLRLLPGRLGKLWRKISTRVSGPHSHTAQ